MPIYEFVCDACEARFELLVELGAAAADCPACGAPGARRVLSAPAPAMRLVKSRGETRKQERANAALHKRTKERFKERRAAARKARKRSGGERS